MALGIAKPQPHLLVREKNKADRKKLDDAESKKVKARSKGRCEVIKHLRCNRRASEVHHHIGGWKLRGRGESALAVNKTHACRECHRLITGNALEHLGGNRYRRVT